MKKYTKILSLDNKTICPICKFENNHLYGNVCNHVDRVTAEGVVFFKIRTELNHSVIAINRQGVTEVVIDKCSERLANIICGDYKAQDFTAWVEQDKMGVLK